MYTDSHCHLDPDVYGGDDGVDAAIARARADGVTRMITIGSGYSLPSAERARDVARRHPDVWFTVGVHPHDAKDWDAQTPVLLERLFAEDRCVGLGEMGLDFHYDNSPRDVQRAVLRDQIRLSLRIGAPIVIHDRESDGETLRILEEEGAFAGNVLYHCYTGDVRHMEEITGRGGYISIPGIVTFKNAAMMQEVAAKVPDDRLLVETDSPFLTPIPFRGQKNEPARVALVAKKVAELRGIPPEALGELTTRNTVRFFGLDV
jgi:TatD DNase family protein